MTPGPGLVGATETSGHRASTARAASASSTVIRIRSVVPRRVPGGPSATRRPRAITPTRSHIASTSARRWLEMKIVVPPSASRRRSSRISRIPDGSSPFVGSSSVSSSGSPTKASAIPSRWRIPWLYCFTRLPAASVNPTVCNTSSIRPSRARTSVRSLPARANASRLRRPER